METEPQVTIYALCEPDTNEIRYIGQTVNLQTRLSAHRRQRENGSEAKQNWILDLRKRRLTPILKVLATVSTMDADAAERDAIAQAIQDGAKLLNRIFIHGDDAKNVILQPIHLGKGEQGRKRRAALERIAANEGHVWNGKPSIGRWLVALADRATSA